MVVSIKDTTEYIQIRTVMQIFLSIFCHTNRLPSSWQGDVFRKLEVCIFKGKSLCIYFVPQCFYI